MKEEKVVEIDKNDKYDPSHFQILEYKLYTISSVLVVSWLYTEISYFEKYED